MSTAKTGPKPPRKLSKREQAARDRARKAGTAVLPYAAALGAAGIPAAMGSQAGAMAVLGATAMHAVIRLHEAHGWHRSGGKAAARQRRRYQGTATVPELYRALSLRAARRKARFTRPSLSGRLPRVHAGVTLGRTTGFPRLTLTGSHEDFYAVFAPARGGKTLRFLARTLHEHPGPALATSTRVDLWAHTVHARRDLAEAHGGQVWVLNPGGDGLIGSDLAWSPLAGCERFPRACDAAGHLMAAAPKDPGGGDAWIDDRGAQLLRVMMHAAAVAGGDMQTVLDWCRHPGSAEPMSVLESGHADWHAARDLEALLGASEGTHLQSVIVTAESALSWLSDPVMRAAACPDGDDLDAWEFLESCSSIYLVGQNKPYNALTRYFQCLAGWLFDRAKQHASMQPGGRLDPPLGMFIDEPAITCRVPLPQWSAEAGGHGIMVVTGFQSFAQPAACWGEHDARTLLDNSVKLIMGGFTAADELERISAACGDRDTWHHVTSPDGSKTRQPSSQRLFPAERLRTLRPAGKHRDPHAVLLYRTVRPALVSLPPVTRCAGYRRALTGLEALNAVQPQAMAALPAAPETTQTEIAPAGAGREEATL